MKKLTGFLLAILVFAVVSISFTSCGEPEEPDVPNVPEESGAGYYNPKKKISKMYLQVEGGPEYIDQEWVWKGNKVRSITHYHNGAAYVTEEFIYEGNRLIEIRNNHGHRTEYTYNNKRFEKIRYYTPADFLAAEITFQYDGDKISVMTLNKYDVDKNIVSMIERSLMRNLLSGKGGELVSKKLANQIEETIVMDLSYEGENLSSMSMDGIDIYTYSDFDTHANVWCGFFPFIPFNDVNFDVLSKNNPGKWIIRADEQNSINVTYDYIYNLDFPVMIKTTATDGTFTQEVIIRIEYR